MKNINKVIIGLIIVILVVSGVLVYELTKEKNTIELFGEDSVTVFIGHEYVEAGYYGTDRDGNDITDKVIVTSSVDSSKLGTYEIVYTLGKTVAKRTVNVTNDPHDDIKFSYSGDSLTLWVSSVYTIPSISCYDKVDGDISSLVKVKNNIDINNIGEYAITYSVTNSRNVSKDFVLKVIVKDFEYLYKEEYINKKLTATISFGDSIFSYVLLPDNNTTHENSFSFVYLNNNFYIYKIYDINNNYIEIVKEVKNIDKTAPSVSCVNNLEDNGNRVIVTAIDDNEIINYNYKSNSFSKDLTSNEYFYSDLKDTLVTVSVTDVAGNVGSSACTISDVSKKYSRSYTSEKSNTGLSYYLYIPSTLTARNNLPLVVYVSGSGERGSLDAVNKWCFPSFANDGKDYDFIMLAPQVGPSMSETKLYTLINEVIEKYHFENSKIIMSGFSLGARDTVTMLYKYPDFFAAGITFEFVSPGRFTDKQLEIVGSRVPMLGFHGTNDSNLAYDKKMYNIFNKANPKSKLVVLDGYSHTNATTVSCYNNKDLNDFIAMFKNN